MADDTDKQAEQEQADNSNMTVKRRLKAPTETVRERGEKHRKLQADASDSPKRSPVRLFFAGFFWPVRWLARQVAKLGRYRFFRAIGYILVPRYFRNSWRELRLVTWPDRRKTFKLTYAVIVFSVLFGVIVFAVDTILDKIFKELILK